MIAAEGDFVIVHGQFSGTGRPRNRIAAEVLLGSDLVMLSPPVALPEWHIDMYWGAASASEPTASWIRSQLSEIGQQIRSTGK